MFASLRERVGENSVEIEVAEGATLGDVVVSLTAQHQGLSEHRFTTALNGRYATATVPVSDGDEVALIPPVSGG